MPRRAGITPRFRGMMRLSSCCRTAGCLQHQASRAVSRLPGPLCLLQQHFSGLGDFFGEFLLAGQRKLVLAGQNLVVQISQRVVSDGFVLLRAKDQSQGWVLMGQSPVLPRIVQVQIHLSGIGVGEFSDLQIDYYQAAQSSMKEQQIDAIPLVTDAQASLPCQEREVAAQFEKKLLQSVDQRVLE